MTNRPTDQQTNRPTDQQTNRPTDQQTLTYEVSPGQHIKQAAKEAIALSSEAKQNVSFVFNGANVTVTPESTTDEAVQAFNTESNRKAEEYRNSPEGKAAAVESERLAEEAKLLNAGIDQKIDGIEIQLADADGWNTFAEKNSDPYGSGVVRYTERWAKLMQVEMASGSKLEDIADKTSHEADNEGITGFMYGAAVSTLAQTWKHGEQLRRWHNKDAQLGNEGDAANENGGVLNPAVLNLG